MVTSGPIVQNGSITALLTDVDVAVDDRERRDDRLWRDLPSLDPWRLPMLIPDERQDVGHRRTRPGHFQHAARFQLPCKSGALRRDDDAAVSRGESLANGGRCLIVDEIQTPVFRGVERRQTVDDEVALSGYPDGLSYFLLVKGRAQHVKLPPGDAVRSNR